MQKSGRHLEQLTPFDNSYRPSFSGPLGRRIAYSHPQGLLRSQIWVMASDGTEKRRVTDARASAHSPAFSPNGKWIAYDRSDQIYKMRSDGSRVQRLTHSDRPSSSPSFVDDDVIYTMNRRGRDLDRVTPRSWNVDQPDWAVRR